MELTKKQFILKSLDYSTIYFYSISSIGILFAGTNLLILSIFTIWIILLILYIIHEIIRLSHIYDMDEYVVSNPLHNILQHELEMKEKNSIKYQSSKWRFIATEYNRLAKLDKLALDDYHLINSGSPSNYM